MVRIENNDSPSVFDILEEKYTETKRAQSLEDKKTWKAKARRLKIKEQSNLSNPQPLLSSAMPPPEKPTLPPPSELAPSFAIETRILEKLKELHVQAKEFRESAIREAEARVLKATKSYKEKKDEVGDIHGKGAYLDLANTALSIASGGAAIAYGLALTSSSALLAAAGVSLILSGATSLCCEVLKQSGYGGGYVDNIHLACGAYSLVGTTAAIGVVSVGSSVVEKIGQSVLIAARQTTKAVSATYDRQKETLGALEAGHQMFRENYNENIKLLGSELQMVSEGYMQNLRAVVLAMQHEIEALRRANDLRG